MTTEEATKLLFNNGIKVLKLRKNCFSVSCVNGQPWDNGDYRINSNGLYYETIKNEWTGREIVKLARSYTDSNQQTTLHKNVKKFSNDKDRTATRDAIKKEDFDKIPSKKRTSESSIWNWD